MIDTILAGINHRVRQTFSKRYLEATAIAWPKPLVYTACGAGTATALVFGYAWQAFLVSVVLVALVGRLMNQDRWGVNGSYARAVYARWAKEDASRG